VCVYIPVVFCRLVDLSIILKYVKYDFTSNSLLKFYLAFFFVLIEWKQSNWDTDCRL